MTERRDPHTRYDATALVVAILVFLLVVGWLLSEQPW